MAPVNHTAEIVLVAYLAFHELQQLRPGKMKLSSHESQRPVIQFPLPVTHPGVNARTAALDHKPQHCVVEESIWPPMNTDERRSETTG
jgi:hypothetical protein